MIGYTKVFSHDIFGGLFANYKDVGSKNPEDPDNKLYSILDKLEDYRNSEGNFQFKLCYPELTWGKEGKTCNEWIQSSNPYTNSTITGFEEISLAFDRNGGYEDWNGLGRNTPGNDIHTVIDDEPSIDDWHCAIGAMYNWRLDKAENISIPGPVHPKSGWFAASKVELYVFL